MTSDFSEARQQRFRNDELFQDRAARGVHRRGIASPSVQEGGVTELSTIPPEFLEGISEADAALTQTFYDALMAHYESQDLQLNPNGFSIEEQLGNSARALLETAHQQFDYWTQFSTGSDEMTQGTDSTIIGPITESLSLTPEEVEQAHAVVDAIEAERQARQPSRRPSRQELSPPKKPSESAAALQAMIAAREQARTDDRRFEEDSRSLPHRRPRPVTAEQAALFRIATPPQPGYALGDTEPDNGFTAEQLAEMKAVTAPVDEARAAAEDIIDAHHRAGGIS